MSSNARRLGELRTKTIVAFLAFLILAFIVFGVSKRFEFFIFVANLLGFESDEAPPGVGIVGVDLTSGTLKYFTGEKWREIPIDKDFRIAGYLIKPSDVKERFYNFYVKEERRPGTFEIEVNHWRYWDVSSLDIYDWGRVLLISNTKKGYAGQGFYYAIGPVYSVFSRGGKLGEWVHMDYDNSLKYEVDAYKFIFEHEKSSPAFQNVIAWRDQILEGNSCEKFLTLNLKKDDLDVPKKFTVRKLDNYIFVDLERPVLEGRPQEWDNLDCFKISEYKEADTSLWSNDAGVSFYVEEKKEDNTWAKIWWKPNTGWEYEGVRTGKTGVLKLGEYDNNKKIYLDINGERSKLYFEDNLIYIAPGGLALLPTPTEIGEIKDNKVNIFNRARTYSGFPPKAYGGINEFNREFGSGVAEKIQDKTIQDLKTGVNLDTGNVEDEGTGTEAQNILLNKRDSRVPEVYWMDDSQQSSFYDGFKFLSSKNGAFAKMQVEVKEVYVRLADADKISVSVEGLSDEWGDLDINKKNSFVYNVLDRYNKYFLPLFSDGFLSAPEYVFTPQLFDSSSGSVLGVSLNRIKITRGSSPSFSATEIDRIAVYKDYLGFVKVYDILTRPHKSIGTVGNDGTIIIDDISDSSLEPHLNAINGKNLNDLYYEYNDGDVNFNLFLIKKALLPANLQSNTGGSS